ncbi:MAG: hypothetical protein KBT21_02865 [Treponema sp.]|nr:hypothetical protein [Candidatus Treponema merdequi]
MNMIKKVSALFIVCGIFLTSAFAVDGGALVKNNTVFKTDKNQNFYLDQNDIVTAWLKIPFAGSSENYFICEGIYKFEYDQNLNKSFNYVDLNLVKFAFTVNFENSRLQIDAGRFYHSLFAPVIYSQCADGAKISFSNRVLTASIYGAYTGLLNGNIFKMINSSDFKSVKEDETFSFADKYIISAETVKFDNLFCNQTLGVQFASAVRLNEIEDTRIYASLLLNGPIVNNLIYNLDATASFTNYGNSGFETSALVRFMLGYYFSKASVSANVVYASDKFKAVTKYAALNNFSESPYNSLFKPGISVTCKPFDNLLFTADFNAAFDTAKSFELKGVEYDFSANYQIFSDLFAGVKWNQYFDVNKSDVNYNSISVQIKMAF